MSQNNFFREDCCTCCSFNPSLVHISADFVIQFLNFWGRLESFKSSHLCTFVDWLHRSKSTPFSWPKSQIARLTIFLNPWNFCLNAWGTGSAVFNWPSCGPVSCGCRKALLQKLCPQRKPVQFGTPQTLRVSQPLFYDIHRGRGRLGGGFEGPATVSLFQSKLPPGSFQKPRVWKTPL